MEKWNRLKFSEVVLNFFLDYYPFILFLLFESSKVRLSSGNKKRTRAIKVFRSCIKFFLDYYPFILLLLFEGTIVQRESKID